MLAARSVNLLERVRMRAEAASAAGGDPIGFGFLELIPLILDMAAKFIPLLANCKQQPPPTPPVPAALIASGVTGDTWTKAWVSKYAAMQSVDGDGFSKAALRRATAEIRKSKHVKKKAATPMALAALQSGRDETAEDIAIAMQGVVSNASQFGA